VFYHRLILLASLFLSFVWNGIGAQVLSLAGPWNYALDRADAGLREKWFTRTLASPIQLPNSLPAAGIGDPITTNTPWTGGIVDRSFFTAPEFEKYRQPGNVKVPFWLQPETYYAGVAWYQRTVELPASWEGQHLFLFLERPHWETRVWVDGQACGTQLSLATPHEHDLGFLAAGRHTFTIRVDNRLLIDVGNDSHSVSDHTQGNWNGLVGKIELRATSPVWIEELQVYPQRTNSTVKVRGRIGNATQLAGEGSVRLRVRESYSPEGRLSRPEEPREVPVHWEPKGGSFEQEIPVMAPVAWDEFHPVLYSLEAQLVSGEGRRETKTVEFGFRDFLAEGTQFRINGRKTFIRGTLECCIFPKTGHPPTDVESWERVIRAAKGHGLNNLRFHSWCPPEAAFGAADRLGMYLHVECSSWANASTTLGDGKPVDEWIYQEANAILRYYGNHPSFVLMLYGNEPGGARHKEFLSRWVRHYRNEDPRRLYSSGAGWPQLPENQFHVSPDPRIQAWGAGLKSRINALAPETCTDYREYVATRPVPVISHEIGQWCVYPNFDEMHKYTGYLKPRNFEIFRDTLAAHHLGEMAKPFLLASGKLQVLCYKEEIESALRTPGLGGFQLLDLHDFPGQGTALVGVLDPFWESKGYVTAEQFRRFCGPTVPLARLKKRVFTQDEQTLVELEVAHFGAEPLKGVYLISKLVGDDGIVRFRDASRALEIPLGNGQPLQSVEVKFNGLPCPARYRWVVSVVRRADGSGLIAENDWDIWLYPRQVDTTVPAGVSLVHTLTDESLSTLRKGGKVIWCLEPSRVAPDLKLGPVALGFSSIFWNTAWTHRQAPHTLGILCQPNDPLFAEFPTDASSNWQWWYLVSRAGAMILDDLPTGLRPTVQVIDDWFTARRLGLVFEAKVERGRLLVCSIDLDRDLPNNPVARQFRHSLFQYASGDRFQPKTEVRPDALRALAKPADQVGPGSE
jgi:hypothetical protein